MARTPEGKVKDFIDAFVRAKFPDVWRYCPQAGFMGTNGVPDRIYLWRGVFIAIEAKAEGGSPSALQWHQLKHIARQGGVAAVCVGRDLAKLEKIYAIVMERVQVADEAARLKAIRSPIGNGQVPPAEQAGV